MYNSASEIIAIHKKNGGDIANFGAPSDYDHLYVITQGDLTLAYAARGGKCLVEIPKKEFNKRQKHADIEYINVSLDSDAALLPPYCWLSAFLREFPFWRRRCRLFIRYCIRYHPLRHSFLSLSGNPVKITESGWRWKPPVSGVIRP